MVVIERDWTELSFTRQAVNGMTGRQWCQAGAQAAVILVEINRSSPDSGNAQALGDAGEDRVRKIRHHART